MGEISSTGAVAGAVWFYGKMKFMAGLLELIERLAPDEPAA
jgi:hypothetical protein